MWLGTSRLALRPAAPAPGLMARVVERQSGRAVGEEGKEGSELGRKGVEVAGFSRGRAQGMLPWQLREGEQGEAAAC